MNLSYFDSLAHRDPDGGEIDGCEECGTDLDENGNCPGCDARDEPNDEE